MTHLRSYLTETRTSQSALAGAINVSRGYMSELVNGAKTPGLQLAILIERATGGAVPASSWEKVEGQQ